MVNKQSFNYSKEKNGWVRFKDKRRKMKLRKWITIFARDIAKITNAPVNKVKAEFIAVYNKTGVIGVENTFFINKKIKDGGQKKN